MQYRFCSSCGAKLEQGRAFRPQHCHSCGAWHFHNSKPCAGAIVIESGRVLLAKRAVEPFKGRWDIPGGFLEPGEHPEEGARRELLEETGLEVRLKALLGMYVDSYGAGNDYTLNIYYLAEPIRGVLRATDDVAALEWFSLDALPNQLAFAHEHQVLQEVKRRLMTND